MAPKNDQQTNSSISDFISDSVPGYSGHSVLSTEGVFCHSVLPVEEILQENLCHSVLSMEVQSQMNCASIQQMAE